MPLCADCKHDKEDHKPPKEYLYMKGNFGNGGVPSMLRMVPIVARSCCWSNPLCSCLEYKPMTEENNAEQTSQGPTEETREGGPRENPNRGANKKAKRGPSKRKADRPSNPTMGFNWDGDKGNKD